MPTTSACFGFLKILTFIFAFETNSCISFEFENAIALSCFASVVKSLGSFLSIIIVLATHFQQPEGSAGPPEQVLGGRQFDWQSLNDVYSPLLASQLPPAGV